jgi:hypothetical protein
MKIWKTQVWSLGDLSGQALPSSVFEVWSWSGQFVDFLSIFWAPAYAVPVETDQQYTSEYNDPWLNFNFVQFLQ